MQLFRFKWASAVVFVFMGLVLIGFESDRVVARVNGEEIILADLLQRMRNTPARQPSEDEQQHHKTEAAINEALEKIINNRVLIQEAKTSGIAEVTEEEFHKTFTPSHMTLPNLSDRSFQEDWVVGVLRERMVEKLMPKVSVKEREIKKRFEELRFSFQPEVAVIRWIVVANEREAHRLIDQIQAGADFGHLAQKVSIEEVSAKGGGMVGAVRPDKIPAELSEVIFAQSSQPGLIPQPIEVQNPIPFYGPAGWYIVKIDQIVRQGEASLDTWRPVVEHMIRKENASQLLEERLAKRRKQAKIWIEKDLTNLVENLQSSGQEK
jgi:parvulin-like peptidyl-prolyl isomerase